jgi:hypothetical protein
MFGLGSRRRVVGVRRGLATTSRAGIGFDPIQMAMTAKRLKLLEDNRKGEKKKQEQAAQTQSSASPSPLPPSQKQAAEDIKASKRKYWNRVSSVSAVR